MQVPPPAPFLQPERQVKSQEKRKIEGVKKFGCVAQKPEQPVVCGKVGMAEFLTSATGRRIAEVCWLRKLEVWVRLPPS